MSILPCVGGIYIYCVPVRGRCMKYKSIWRKERNFVIFKSPLFWFKTISEIKIDICREFWLFLFDNFQLLDLVVGLILKYPSCIGLIEWFARYIKSVPNHSRDARCFKNIYMLKCSEQMYIILNISYFPKQLPCNTWNMNPYLTVSQTPSFRKSVKGGIRFLVN